MFKRLSSAALFLALFATGVPVAGAVPAHESETPAPPVETCDAPIRRFRGGGGRQPGATVVVLAMRQTIRNAKDEFVPASSLQTKALVTGDEVHVRVQVLNRSIYDVANVVMRHQFRPAPGGPSAEGVASVTGAVYSGQDGEFVIPYIAAGDEALVTFRILLRGFAREGVAQTKMTLEDFTLLDSSSRYPLPTSLTPPDRSRMNVERIGLGAVEVSCFEGAVAEEVMAARPELLRLPVARYAPEREVPATAGTVESGMAVTPEPEIVMPQAGADMARMFLLAAQGALGMMIGAGLFGAGMFIVLKRIDR